MIIGSLPCVDNLYEEIRENGYFVIKDCIDTDVLKRLRAEFSDRLDQDAARRDAQGKPIYFDDGGVRTDLTGSMHNILFPSFISVEYASILDAIFSNAIINDLLKLVAGPFWRLRVDLVRRATGIDDWCDEVQIPHQWHRDSPGEFTFGFFLDDFTQEDSGATAVVPGSHWKEYNPVWDFLMGPDSRTTKEVYNKKARTKFRLFPNDRLAEAAANRRMRDRFGEERTAIRGRMGDLFLFLNDLHHGRWPNRTGERKMLARIGGFGQGFPFKADLGLPNISQDGNRDFVRHFLPRPAASPEGTLLHEISTARRPDPLFDEAAQEKRRLVSEIENEMSGGVK